MFARLLAKKKEPGYVEDASEKRMKKIMDVVGKVDEQIDTFTKQLFICFLFNVELKWNNRNVLP